MYADELIKAGGVITYRLDSSHKVAREMTLPLPLATDKVRGPSPCLNRVS
jgi:hypothetical protein